MIKAVNVFEAANVVGSSFDFLYKDASFVGVEVDSRKCSKLVMFVALLGENVDGHNFIESALGMGTKVFLVKKDFVLNNRSKVAALHKEEHCSFLVVDSSLEALQELAKWHLSNFPNLQKIAITGSNGKTSTKELLARVVGSSFKISYTKGNFNSEIGLPVVVFDIDEDSDIAIFEMGINRVGEMDILVDIVNPDIAIITNIGSAHIGIFGDISITAKEKGKIFSKFSKSCSGFIFEGEAFYGDLVLDKKGNFYKYGMNSTDCVKVKQSLGVDGWLLDIGGYISRINLFGDYNLRNVCSVVSVAQFLGISCELIAKSLDGFKAVSGRGDVLNGEVIIFDDSYNANPDSMIAAIDFFDSLDKDGRKIFIMGSMMELGDSSKDLHSFVGKKLAESSFDFVIFTGEDAKFAYDKYLEIRSADSCKYFIEFGKLISFVKDFVTKDDMVYLKGSRSVGLERVKEVIA